MTSFPVDPDKEAQLAERMAAMGIREQDLEETFVRSGGPGGQNVNKSSTCVMLTHLPSGVRVKCQSTRQQGLNRYLARRLLLEKIETQRRGQAAAERDRREKARRQNRKPSGAARQRTLEQKARRSALKSGRRRVDFEQ